MLQNGAIEYIAHVKVPKEVDKLAFADVPIVQDFVNMFLEEFPGLPMDREVEFIIELVLGA